MFSSSITFSPFFICQVKQVLAEECEQVKGIMGTLDKFKSEKPTDVFVPHPEDLTEDPTVWPPPIPAEHRCVFALPGLV